MTESCVSIENVELELTNNVGDDAVRANVEAALRRGLPELKEAPAHDGVVAICGGGPSLADDLELIRRIRDDGHAVWALNGTLNWLVDQCVYPAAAWCVDSRPENAAFFRRAPWGPSYYIASRCHPEVFAALGGCDVTLWHDSSVRDLVPEDRLIIGGGTTVGVKAMAAAFALGYRRIHLFGFDSSYRSDEHHAYPQALNDGEAIYEATVGNRIFAAAGWMLGQVRNFGHIAPMLADEGCVVTVHGDGLLPAVAAEMATQYREAA